MKGNEKMKDDTMQNEKVKGGKRLVAIDDKMSNPTWRIKCYKTKLKKLRKNQI